MRILGMMVVLGIAFPAWSTALWAQGVAQAPRQDTVALSLDEAVRRALGQSEEIRLARSQLELAEAQVSTARAQALPQLNANLGYTRTFESAFNTGGGGFQIPDSLRFEPDTTASLAERVRYLERRAPNAGLGGIGQLFGNLPFGRENAYTATLSGSQILYSGGRVGAALNIARSFQEATRLNVAEETAELELQVRSAYFQALLAEAVEDATEAALAQAEAFLEQEQLRLRAGRASELEVLRAQVDRDNLRPQLVQARNAAELALLNVKRLTDVPMTQPLVLTSELAPPSPEELADVRLEPEVLTAQRAAILAAEQQVEIREEQVDIARGAFLPNIALQMNYGRQLFPSEPFQFDTEWRTDWAMTLGVQLPLFTGGRRLAEVQQAQVELQQARLQVAQLRESVQMQYQQALGEKQRAREAITARQATVGVAQRVHDLTVLRYEQGLATQLEVNDARLALLQARTNLAQAITDYYVADAGLTRAGADADAGALPGRPEIPTAPAGGRPPREAPGQAPGRGGTGR